MHRTKLGLVGSSSHPDRARPGTPSPRKCFAVATTRSGAMRPSALGVPCRPTTMAAA